MADLMIFNNNVLENQEKTWMITGDTPELDVHHGCSSIYDGFQFDVLLVKIGLGRFGIPSSISYLL